MTRFNIATMGASDRHCRHICARKDVDSRGSSPPNLSVSSSDTWSQPSQLIKIMDPLDRLFELPTLNIKPGPTAELSALAGRVQSLHHDVYDCKAAEERTPGIGAMRSLARRLF